VGGGKCDGDGDGGNADISCVVPSWSRGKLPRSGLYLPVSYSFRLSGHPNPKY
jgi:hypothetical protein